MKYIDAEKLIKFKEMLADIIVSSQGICTYQDCKDIAEREALLLIATLQQEQPEPSCKTCGFYENNCPFIRGTFKPYPNKVCKDYTYSVMKEQEQMEVDLEKEEQPKIDWDSEIEEYWIATGWSKIITLGRFKVIARYFIGLALNARMGGKQMKELKWTSADILPEKGRELACILTRTDGSIKYDNFDNGPYWWDGEEFVGRNDWGDKTTHCVGYWMYWDDFWEMLENLPRIEKNKEK